MCCVMERKGAQCSPEKTVHFVPHQVSIKMEEKGKNIIREHGQDTNTEAKKPDLGPVWGQLPIRQVVSGWLPRIPSFLLPG